jgi:hypothetical protein
MKTLAFGKVTGKHIYVYVSSSTLAPAEAEWDAYAAFLKQNFRVGVPTKSIVYTRSPPPTALQRKKITDLTKPLGKLLHVSVLTDSSLVRGVVTALSWISGNYTAFALDQLDQALAALAIEGIDAAEVRGMVRKFREELDA